MSVQTYRKGQQIQYQYKKLGIFPMRLPSNISALGIQSTTNFQQLQAIENLDQKFYRVLEDGFKNCTQLTSVSFNQTLTALDPSSFENCISLKQLTLPSSLESIGDRCFKNCNNLKIASFDWFDEEIPSGSTASTSQLTALGSEAFAGCTALNSLVVPASITSISQIAKDALKGSNISQVSFLGIPSSAKEDICSKEVFGNSKNCAFFTSDSKKFIYSAQAKSISEDTSYNIYGNVQSASLNEIKLRKFYRFEQEAVEWCLNSSSKDGRRFPQVPCPIIVVYGDFKTSAISKQFLENVIKDQQFQKSLQASLNCYLFLLSRNGQIEKNSSVDSNLLYFRDTLNARKQIERQFMSLNFYYGSNFSTTTTISTNPSEVLELLKTGAERTGFKKFDYSKFDIKLEEPYVETIPSGSGSAQNGYNPWWWTGSQIQDLPEWNPS